MKKIKVGKKYRHSLYGNVTVDSIEITTEKQIKFLINFTPQFGSSESQGENGFMFNVGLTESPWV